MPIYNGMLPAIDKAEVKRYAGLRHAEDFRNNMWTKHVKKFNYQLHLKVYIKKYDYDAETKTILSNPPLKIEGSIIEKHLRKVYKSLCIRHST